VNDALIIVDVQKDFLPGGALAVPHGDEVIPEIERLAASRDWTDIVLTADWHRSDNIEHFTKWPVHCVQGTAGAQIDPRIRALVEGTTLEPVFSKGMGAADDGYSGFEGMDDDETLLDDRLALAGVRNVTVVGLALDYCVKATALDAARLGYNVTVPLAATRAVNLPGVGGGDQAIADLRLAGITVED
jgi:nicotinamidase/pyrazinamidase